MKDNTQLTFEQRIIMGKPLRDVVYSYMMLQSEASFIKSGEDIKNR